jgi:hypothetical protein
MPRQHLISPLLVLCLVLLALVLFPSSSMQAKVTGNCSNCHTMHNSQSGGAVAKDASGTSQNTPVEFLLNRGGGGKTSCWGCHAKGTPNNVDNYGAPQILHTAGIDLAGGNFAYLTGGKSITSGNQYVNGHNVLDVGVQENTLLSPPGDEQSTGIVPTNFTCAGSKGCHGDRSIDGVGASLKGAHHYNDIDLQFGGPINEANQAKASGTTGQKVGSSYRFLMGVKGGEAADWRNTDASNHNEYKGATPGVESGNAYTPGGGTISGFCAECHGNFHGGAADIGGSSPWLRHPTDISLPATGEYANYTSYSVVAPVARTAIPNSPSNTVTPTGSTDDIVMCLSCHTSHASANGKLMRWNTKSTTLSEAISGCGVCHTSKN